MAEGKYDDQIAALHVQIDQLQRENQNMQRALTEVANANVLPRVLENGFADVIAQLRPLRDLTPERESVEQPIAAAVAAMLEAMEGVTLKGDSLGIPVVNVPFIGEPRPDVSSTPGSGGAPVPSPGQSDPYQTPGKPTHQIPGGGYRP